jgi:hypothetical protein
MRRSRYIRHPVCGCFVVLSRRALPSCRPPADIRPSAVRASADQGSAAGWSAFLFPSAANVSALIATRCDGRCCQSWRCIPARRLRVKPISCRAPVAERRPERQQDHEPVNENTYYFGCVMPGQSKKQLSHLSLAPVTARHQELESRYCAVTRLVFRTCP